MIIDHIKNIQCYDTLLPGLGKAYALVAEMSQGKGDGRYEFEGGFFLIQTGQTKPMDEGNFEAHRRYADIQIVIEGSEEVAWAELSDLHEEIAYNPELISLVICEKIRNLRQSIATSRGHMRQKMRQKFKLNIQYSMTKLAIYDKLKKRCFYE